MSISLSIHNGIKSSSFSGRKLISQDFSAFLPLKYDSPLVVGELYIINRSHDSKFMHIKMGKGETSMNCVH